MFQPRSPKPSPPATIHNKQIIRDQQGSFLFFSMQFSMDVPQQLQIEFRKTLSFKMNLGCCFFRPSSPEPSPPATNHNQQIARDRQVFLKYFFNAISHGCPPTAINQIQQNIGFQDDSNIVSIFMFFFWHLLKE